MGGKTSAQRRVYEGELEVWPADASNGWRAIRIVEFAYGLDKVARGEWDLVDDPETGEPWYFQMRANFRTDEELPAAAGASSSSITARESKLNAMTVFRDGRSHTAGMSEERRISRKDKFGKPLPPEDAVERVQAKVAEFGKARIVATPMVADVSAKPDGWDAHPELATVLRSET
jgi:hypothetical protein